MKEILFILSVALFQIPTMAQTAKTDLSDLVKTFNTKVKPTISLKLNGDTISFEILGDKMLYYRPKKPTGLKLSSSRGIKRSEGSTSWHHQFNSITATSSHFQSTPKNHLQLIFTFAGKKEHIIHAKKGLQGCIVSGADYMPLDIIWSGHREIVLSFDHENLNNHTLKVQKVSLNGTLKRMDGKRISHEFTMVLTKKIHSVFKDFLDSESVIKSIQNSTLKP
ncbi:hypothetical protein [Costertonia aggregata]|uniref:Uncharacterized protein n=1 Tax=Costertonia aggregata TaxID=343403 RepID=A0A7H9AR35_9FLAO|nr:hypothetical protein [Costertonia aggregata]QLG45928.1 hypothetical protein HYG79_11395 [Costertonia aggregata]